MRERARTSSAKLIRYSGLPRALRFLRRHRAAIVFYHQPAPDLLDAHLRYLSARYRFTTLDLLVDALRQRDWSRLPERALVVTLDDGDRSNADLLPVFRRHGVRPTIYVCTQVVGTLRRFWFREPTDVQALKRLPDAERLAALRAATGFEPERAYPASARQALSLDEIRAMAPDVDFAAHTRFHPVLTRCDDATARLEIEGSRGDLEALLGQPCRHFSYPNGEYSERDVDLVRKAGFASARTTDLGSVGPETDPYRLPVFGLTDEAPVDMLAAQLSGIPRYLRNLSRGRLGSRWPPIPPGEPGAGA